MHGYLTVFGGVCIHLFCGNLYLWANIQPYVLSHLHYGPANDRAAADKSVTPDIGLLVLPISFYA